MRKIILLISSTLFFFCILQAQTHRFLRIFDLSGKKIAKGFLSTTTDTSIKLEHDSKAIEYSASKIGFIKTKRSGGHTMLISTAAGGVSLGLLALAVNSNDNSDGLFQFSGGEAFAGGFIYGTAIGAIAGGIITAVNKRMTYQVNGELKKWMEVKAALEK